MNDREKKLIKYKKHYLNIVYKITQLQLSGEDPPEELLKKAKEIGHAADIPERFLKSILL